MGVFQFFPLDFYWPLSFGLSGVARLLPFFPAALQSENLLKSQVIQFSRHPDDGALPLSVEEDLFVIGQFVSPGCDLVWIPAHRTLDLFVADIPIFGRPDIQNHYIAVGEPAFYVLFVQEQRFLAAAVGPSERQHQACCQRHGPKTGFPHLPFLEFM